MENETRLAILSLLVEKREGATALNALLSEYGDYIVGRMGIPYKKKKISVISVVIDAPMDVLNGLSGKLGALVGVSSKLLVSKI